MFQARPISLSTEVWDRIDTYLNQKAAEDRAFKPNRSAFVEEAVIAFLDAAEKGPEAESSDSDSVDLSDLDFGSSDTDSTDTESSETESSDSTDEFSLSSD